jgi:hypothetical protein
MQGEMKVSDEQGTAGERVADALRLDGNAAAGILSEIFLADLTSARATCASCGAARPIGALLAYAHGMGIVVRCPDCDCVVLRAARTPTRIWLDMRGAASIAYAPSSTAGTTPTPAGRE